MMKQWRGLMAKIPTLRARAKANHLLNHGGSSLRQSSGFNQLFLASHRSRHWVWCLNHCRATKESSIASTMIGLKTRHAVCRIMSKEYPALLKRLTIRLKVYCLTNWFFLICHQSTNFLCYVIYEFYYIIKTMWKIETCASYLNVFIVINGIWQKCCVSCGFVFCYNFYMRF